MRFILIFFYLCALVSQAKFLKNFIKEIVFGSIAINTLTYSQSILNS